MKFTVISSVGLIFSATVALAQNASTGSTVTTGDSAVSSATANPVGDPARSEAAPTPGNGVNSGTSSTGTTGDTIGTGRGTSNGGERPSSAPK
jgi:hypothetical protein